MQPLRILTCVFVALTFGILNTVATPVDTKEVIVKRQEDNALAILNDLKSKTDTILPQIDTLADSDAVTEENIVPLLDELTAALDAAGTSFEALGPLATRDLTRRTQLDIVLLICAILNAIVITLHKLLKFVIKIPIILVCFGKIEICLDKILIAIELILAGVIKLVASLLITIALLLKDLGWSLIIKHFNCGC